jgi:hypothetical protein
MHYRERIHSSSQIALAYHVVDGQWRHLEGRDVTVTKSVGYVHPTAVGDSRRCFRTTK